MALALDEGRLLLSTLSSRDDDCVRRGFAFFELASLMQTLKVDCIPLQLKSLSSEQLVEFILGELPLGHLNIDSLDAVDESIDLSADEETLRQVKLISQPLPARRLIETALAIETNPVDRDIRSKIMLTVNSKVLQLNDLRASFLLCMELLQRSELSAMPAEAVVEACTSLASLLDANDSEEEYMHRTLMANLLVFKPELVSMSDQCSSAIAVQLNDEELICEAHRLLLRLIGIMLVDDGDPSMLRSPIPPVEEVVKVSNSASTLSDIIAYLSVVADNQKVEAMLQKLVADLQRKLSTSAHLAEELPLVVSVNEEVVEQLLSMGFPRNAALKAAMSTGSAEDAVTWAIEHSSQPDFNEPIVQIVEGALLPESSGFPTNIVNVQGCLDMVQLVHKTVSGQQFISTTRVPSRERIGAEPISNSIMSSSDVYMRPNEECSSREGSYGQNLTVDNNVRGLQSVLSRASHMAKLQSIIDVAEDFTGLLSSKGASISAFTRQLSEGDSVARLQLEELLLALAFHSDLTAYSLLPKILGSIPKQLLECIQIVLPTLPATQNLPELAFDVADLQLNDEILWRLGLHRLVSQFSFAKSDEDLKASCEVLFCDLVKLPSM